MLLLTAAAPDLQLPGMPRGLVLLESGPEARGRAWKQEPSPVQVAPGLGCSSEAGAARPPPAPTLDRMVIAPEKPQSRRGGEGDHQPRAPHASAAHRKGDPPPLGTAATRQNNPLQKAARPHVPQGANSCFQARSPRAQATSQREGAGMGQGANSRAHTPRGTRRPSPSEALWGPGQLFDDRGDPRSPALPPPPRATWRSRSSGSVLPCLGQAGSVTGLPARAPEGTWPPCAQKGPGCPSVSGNAQGCLALPWPGSSRAAPSPVPSRPTESCKLWASPRKRPREILVL